jgi:hypothetical protein
MQGFQMQAMPGDDMHAHGSFTFACQLIAAGALAGAYGYNSMNGAEDRANETGLATMGVGGLMFLISLWFWYTGGFHESIFMWGIEAALFTIGLTWVKSNGDLTLVKKAEAICAGVMGLSIVFAEERMAASVNTPEVGVCFLAISFAAMMFVHNSSSQNKVISALAWMLLGEWLVAEAYFRYEETANQQKKFNAVHLAMICMFNWVCFLFVRDGLDLNSGSGPSGERSKLVGGNPYTSGDTGF